MSAEVLVELNAKFALPILVVFVLTIEYVWCSFSCMVVRKECFGTAHMKNFKEVHAQSHEDQLPPTDGYPDTGCGYYSKTLSYGQWYKFNNWMRSHRNFLEFIYCYYAAILVCGAYNPRLAWYLGGALTLVRIFFFKQKFNFNREDSGPR
jgi:hypothetical protein